MVKLFSRSKGGKSAAQPATDGVAGAKKPSAAATTPATVKVKVPPGGKPGKAISVEKDGQRHVIQLPPGAKPGAVIEVEVPPPDAAGARFTADDASRDVPIAAEVVTDKASTQAPLFDVASEDAAASAGKAVAGSSNAAAASPTKSGGIGSSIIGKGKALVAKAAPSAIAKVGPSSVKATPATASAAPAAAAPAAPTETAAAAAVPKPAAAAPVSKPAAAAPVSKPRAAAKPTPSPVVVTNVTEIHASRATGGGDDDGGAYIAPVVRKAFAHFDVDSSGDIDAAELRPALAKLGMAADAAEAKAILQGYDTHGDADGCLDLVEFAQLVQKLLAWQAEEAGVAPPQPVYVEAAVAPEPVSKPGAPQSGRAARAARVEAEAEAAEAAAERARAQVRAKSLARGQVAKEQTDAKRAAAEAAAVAKGGAPARGPAFAARARTGAGGGGSGAAHAAAASARGARRALPPAERKRHRAATRLQRAWRGLLARRRCARAAWRAAAGVGADARALEVTLVSLDGAADAEDVAVRLSVATLPPVVVQQATPWMHAVALQAGTQPLAAIRDALLPYSSGSDGGAAAATRPPSRSAPPPRAVSAEVQRAFAHFDADNSGGIDAAELTAALAQLGIEASHDEAAEVLARYDDAEAGDAGRSGRRDGKLDVFELQALVDDLIHFQQQQQATAQGLPPPLPPPSRQRTQPPPPPPPLEGGLGLPLTIELLSADGAVVAAEATLDLAAVAAEHASSAVATYEVPMSDGSAATLSINVSQALLPLMRIGRAFAAADERGMGVVGAAQAEAAAAALGLPQAAAAASEDEMDVLRFERWIGEMAPLHWRRDEVPGGRGGGKGRGGGGGGAGGAARRPMLVQHKQTLELRDGESASFVVDGASELQLLSVRQMRAPSALRLLLGAADASAASRGVAHAAAASHAAVEAAAAGITGSDGGGGDGAVLYDGAAYAHRGAGALVKGGDAWVFPGGRCYELAAHAPHFSPAVPPPPQSAAAEAATIVRGGGRAPPPPPRRPAWAAEAAATAAGLGAEATLLVVVRVVSRIEAGSGLEIIDEPTHKLLLPPSRQRPASAAASTSAASAASAASVSTKAATEAKVPRPTSGRAAALHARTDALHGRADAAVAAAGNVTVGVTCPAGCKAGDAIQVEHGGRMFDLVVPAGVAAGHAFDAVLPIATPPPPAGAAGKAAAAQAAAKAKGTKALPLGKAAQAAVRRASAAVHPAPATLGSAAAPVAAAVFKAPHAGSAWGGGAMPLGAAPHGAAGGAWSGAAGATTAASGWAGYMPALGMSGGGGSGGAPWAHAPPWGGGAAGAPPTQQARLSASALRHAFELFCEGGESLGRASLSRAVRRIGVTLTYRALDLFQSHAAPESGGDVMRFEGFAVLVGRLEAEGAFAQAEQEAACCATVASNSAASSSGRGGGGGGLRAGGSGGAAGRCDGASLLEAAAVSLEYGGRGGRLTTRQLRAVLRTLGLRLEGAETKATLARFDTDLDGELDVFELGRLLQALHAQQPGVAAAGAAASQLIHGGGASAAPPPPPVATLRAAFGALDLRGDGTIATASLRAALARAGVDAGHASVQSTLWELQLRGTTAVDFATFHRVAHAVALDARTTAPTPPAGVPYVAPHFHQPTAAQPLPPSQFAPSGVNPPYPFTSPGVYPPMPQHQPPHPGYAQPPPGLVANPYAPQQQQAWWQPPSQSGAAGWPPQAWGAPHPQPAMAPPWAVREAADRYGTRGEPPAAVGRQAGGWWGSGPPLPHHADIELDPTPGSRPEPNSTIDWRKYEAVVPYAPPSPTSKAERARHQEKKKTEGQRAVSYRAAYALPRDDKMRTAKAPNKSPSRGRKRV